MKIHTMPQGAEEWLAIRKGKISASEAGEFLITATTKAAKGARQNLALKKIAERSGAHMTTTFANAAMKHGNEFEPVARRAYEEHTGNVVEEVGFLESDCGYYGCSPDGLISHDGGVEIKCPSGERHFRYLIEDVLPNEYYHQVHMSMAVTGRQWWDFVSYCPSITNTMIPIFVIRVERNADTEKLLNGITETIKEMQMYEAKLYEIARKQLNKQK